MTWMAAPNQYTILRSVLTSWLATLLGHYNINKTSQHWIILKTTKTLSPIKEDPYRKNVNGYQVDIEHDSAEICQGISSPPSVSIYALHPFQFRQLSVMSLCCALLLPLTQ